MPNDRGSGRTGKPRPSAKGSKPGGARSSGRNNAKSGGPSGRAGGSGRGSSGPGAKRASGGRDRDNRGRSDDRRDSRGRSDDRSGPPSRPGERRPDRDLAGPNHWGRLARRGAGNINYDDPEDLERREARKERELERKRRVAEAEAEAEATPSRPRPERPERVLPDADDLKRSASGAVKRGRKGAPSGRRKPLPARPHVVVDPAVALRRLVGDQRAKSLMRKLSEAGKAFEAERYDDARRALATVVKEAPTLPESRELLGLSWYRLGRWKDAVRELEAFREVSGSTEQNPVLADCYRALKRWRDVDELWHELGEASPSAELVVEGRIVTAGSLADRGELDAAIRMLQQGWRPPKKPRDHHLRRAYALADLYDRAGRTARARELYKWIEGHAPAMADVSARIRALG